jgi:hypothetical protein
MHFDSNIIFIIVAAVIGISRLIARIKENAREQKQRRNRQAQAQTQQKQPPPIFTRPKTDEERVREFLEALGQPAGTAPPPRIQPRTDIPPRPIAPIPPPPLARPFSPVLLKPVAEKVRKVFTPSVIPVPIPATSAEAAQPGDWLREEEKIESAAAKFEAATQAATEYGVTSRQSLGQNWKDLLRSRESVRTALVLREILGPPRALRELEAI